jgi:hypothetical protein
MEYVAGIVLWRDLRQQRDEGAPNGRVRNPCELRALLQVCTTFAGTARPGADIRDYGLTPELLATCTHALAVWPIQRERPGDTGPHAPGDAAWHAYVRMLAEHGEDVV